MAIILQEHSNYTGVKCTCRHCGHTWISRVSHRPLCCAAQCSRQWYWWMDPKDTPEPRKSAKRKKSKR